MTPTSLLSWRTRLGLNKTEAAKALGLSRNGYEMGRGTIPKHVELACAAIDEGLDYGRPQTEAEELAQILRHSDSMYVGRNIRNQAADLIERQDKRIAELEAKQN
jgi:hypothetical protein